MFRGRGFSALCVALAVCAITGGIWALSTGAPIGYSGGRTYSGQSCTSCHTPFNIGTGYVELIGAPARYRPNDIYDLTVRVVAPDEDGASFEISAEGEAGWVGTLLLVPDDVHVCQGGSNNGDFCADGADCASGNCADSSATGYASPAQLYVTHTEDGVLKSIHDWDANGGQYDYHVQWQAPAFDSGEVTFFVGANGVVSPDGKIGDNEGREQTRFYATYSLSRYAVPGDGDGDGDLDLADLARLGACFSDDQPTPNPTCAYLDMDNDGTVSLADYASLITDPKFAELPSSVPAGYVLADYVRGGLLYDRWWRVNGAPTPTGDHPLYPATGSKSGSSTFRCKECHGWDYKGADGVYGSGSHYTGIKGIVGTKLTPQQIFDLLKSSDTNAGGHNMGAYGMTDRDLWDVVKMTLEGVVDTDPLVNSAGVFLGDTSNGEYWFGEPGCSSCHGLDGTDINFRSDLSPAYVGTIANDNPWEFLHKTRFGQPGTSMSSTELLHWPLQAAVDVGTYSQTLP